MPQVTFSPVRVEARELSGVITYYIDGKLIVGVGATIPLPSLADWSQGAIIRGNAVEWEAYAHPGSAGYALISDASDIVWDQTPEWTGQHTFAAGLLIRDDQLFILGNDNDAVIEYDVAGGTNEVRITGADWHWQTNITLESAVSAEPILTLENTNTNAVSASIDFYKNSASPADGDDIGEFNFFGETSLGAKERYAYIAIDSDDVTDGDTAGAIEFFVTMDASERSFLSMTGSNGAVNQGTITFNDSGQDIDFIVEAAGVADAFQVQGSDGEITLGALGAGFVQSDASGVLSSAVIGVGDLPAHASEHEVGGGDLVDHDSLTNFVANEHIDHTSVTLTAGDGLTGGGTIAANRTFDVGAGDGITVNANDVALTTPGTLTVSTGNAAAGNHTHAITSSSNPGAAAAILASDASGYLQLTGLGVGVAPSGANGLYVSTSTTNAVARFDQTGAGQYIAQFEDGGTDRLLIYQTGTIDVTEYIRHMVDVDTSIRFQADQITLSAGGVDMIDIVEDVTDIITLAGDSVVINPTITSKSNATMIRDVNNGLVVISGGTASNIGANITLGGGAHASLADVVRFRVDTAESMRITAARDVAIGATSASAQLHVDQASTTAAQPVILADQADVSEEFINYVATSAASVVNPISTWTSGNSIQGFVRVGINGAFYWMPYYDAPTS